MYFAVVVMSVPSSAYTYRLLASLTLESKIPEEIGRSSWDVELWPLTALVDPDLL